MRDYGKVYTAFWTSEDSRNLSDDGKLLALYLLTCLHGNMLGCFRMPVAYAAEDLKWEYERVSKGFDELFKNGFAYRCEVTNWVFVRHFLKWNKFENWNVGKAAAKLFDALSMPRVFKSLLADALRTHAAFFDVEKLNGIETVPEGLFGPDETLSKQGTPTKPEPNLNQTGAGTKPERVAPDVEFSEEFETAWGFYPDRPGKNKKETHKAWRARLKAGVEARDMVDGVIRYANYCRAIKTESRFIKQPATFFGPDEHFKLKWQVPDDLRPSKDDQRRGQFGFLTGSAESDDGRTIDQ